jgi:hypothetical protein
MKATGENPQKNISLQRRDKALEDIKGENIYQTTL